MSIELINTLKTREVEFCVTCDRTDVCDSCDASDNTDSHGGWCIWNDDNIRQ